MCDYSLQNVASRPAKVGDRLTTHNFGTGTRGFKAADDVPTGPGYRPTAVCILPGTELAFDEPIRTQWAVDPAKLFSTAIFRQINKHQAYVHHDVLEFPDGSHALLTYLLECQYATVLQLPAAPRNEAEAQEQKRVELVG